MNYIIGIGQMTMTDDSIGLRLAQDWENKIQTLNLDQIHALSVPNHGLDLLPLFNDQTKSMLWIDATEMQKSPGQFELLDLEQVISLKSSPRSSHQSDLLSIVHLAKALNLPLPAIKLLAIQPKSLEFGLELSLTLQKQYDTYHQVIQNYLKLLDKNLLGFTDSPSIKT